MSDLYEFDEDDLDPSARVRLQRLRPGYGVMELWDTLAEGLPVGYARRLLYHLRDLARVALPEGSWRYRLVDQRDGTAVQEVWE